MIVEAEGEGGEVAMATHEADKSGVFDLPIDSIE